jgi:outer membrane protein TolC
MKKIFRLPACLFLLPLVLGAAPSEPETKIKSSVKGPEVVHAGKPFAMAELEDLAVRRAPGVEMSQSRGKALEEKLKETKATYRPEFVGRYIYYSQPIFNETAQGFSSIQNYGRLAVSFPVLKRFGLAPGEQGKIEAQIEATGQEEARAVQDTRWQVQELYLDILKDELQAKGHRNLANQLQEAINVAETGYRQREIVRSEILALEKEKTEAVVHADLAANNAETRRDRLAALSGLPPNIRLAPYTPQKKKIPPYNEILKIAKESRPDLEVAKFRAKEYEIDAAHAPYNYVDLRTEAGYIVTDDKTGTGRNSGTVEVRLTVPLRIHSLTKHRRASSQNEVAFWNAYGKEMVGEMEKQLLSALEKYRFIEARLMAVSQQIKLYQENVRTRELLVSRPTVAAAASQLELLAARYQLEGAKLEEVEMEFERDKAYYYLLYAMGVNDSSRAAAGSPAAK